MILAVVSDSHGYVRRLSELFGRQSALPHSERPEMLLHLGDGLCDLDRAELPEGLPMLSVRGNCDVFGSDGTLFERMPCLGGYKILMTHGHDLSVKSGLSRAIAYAAEKGADILLFGHTHKPLAMTVNVGETVCGVTLEKPLYVFNPGSLMERSFGILTLTPKGVLMSHGEI